MEIFRYDVDVSDLVESELVHGASMGQLAPLGRSGGRYVLMVVMVTLKGSGLP